MTSDDRFDLQLATWLRDGAGAAAPDYLEETLDAIGNLHQRPSWSFPGRWLPATFDGPRARASRPVAVLAILGLLLAAGLVALAVVGSRPRVPTKLPAPYGLAATGLLAFDSDGRIVLAEPDGRRTYSLLPSESKQTGATFSRDGTRVAFWQESGPVLEHGESKMASALWVVDVDGTHARNLTPGVAPGVTAFPESFAPSGSWSPDGSSIAFTTGKDAHLYVAATDGDRPPRSIGGPSLFPMFPAWSPDGSLIAFTAMQLGADGLLLPSAPPEVYVIRPDGTGQELVTGGTHGGWTGLQPQWSPDGRTLLYVVDVSDPGVPPVDAPPADEELVVAQRGSTGWSERVVAGPAAIPLGAFSNDGSRIAFMRSRPGVFEGDLFVIGVDGSAEQQISDRLVNLSAPCWSPDDRTVTMLTGPVPDWWKVSLFGWPDQVYVRFPVDGTPPVEIPAGVVNGILACAWQRLAP